MEGKSERKTIWTAAKVAEDILQEETYKTFGNANIN